MVERRKLRPHVLFLHTGWAREYRGAADDPPLGKFGYIEEGNENAGEALNFRAYRGRYYGYAPHHKINLSRLGAPPGADHVDGILVVWTATDPAQGGRYIVGWYRNATVYATTRDLRPNKERPDVIAEAATKDCRLIPADERTFFIPSRLPGWPGIASGFFASETLSAQDLDKVLNYVGGEPSNGFYDGDDEDGGTPRGGCRSQDPELRAEIEAAAVRVVTRHYRARRWRVTSVEKENSGWDLDVRQGGRRLRVEVKGRGGEGAVELTPNEYAAMRADKTRMSYRLAVVWDALSKKPRLTIFEYAPASDSWVAEDGTVLRYKERTGAVCSF